MEYIHCALTHLVYIYTLCSNTPYLHIYTVLKHTLFTYIHCALTHLIYIYTLCSNTPCSYFTAFMTNWKEIYTRGSDEQQDLAKDRDSEVGQSTDG